VSRVPKEMSGLSAQLWATCLLGSGSSIMSSSFSFVPGEQLLERKRTGLEDQLETRLLPSHFPEALPPHEQH
jgi:hypothetical protein